MINFSFIPNRYVVSTRIRTGRSVEGFPFNPNMTEDQYKQLEEKAKEAFEKMPEKLSGDYYPLTGTLINFETIKK